MGSLTERLGYGQSLGFIPRKHFVFTFAAVAAGLCWLQVLHWLVGWNVLRVAAGYGEQHPQGCTGPHCFEVFTCRGMQDVTLHIREPLVSLSGAVVLTMGAFGALRARTEQLRQLSFYLAASAALHAALMVLDGVFMNTCGAYSRNVVEQVLLPSWRLPPPLISRVAQERLSKLAFFPVGEVDTITGGLNTTGWYLALGAILVAALAYAASEAAALAPKVERGPLGLGLHYGIDQWDSTVDQDALRRRRWRGKQSSFIEDTEVAIPIAGVDSHGFPMAKEWPQTYGAVQTKALDFGDDDDEFEQEAPVIDQARNEVEQEAQWAAMAAATTFAVAAVAAPAEPSPLEEGLAEA